MVLFLKNIWFRAVMGDNVFEIEILESDSLLEEESVLNTDVQIINLSNLTIYASTLQHEDRCWYAAKLLLVDSGYQSGFGELPHLLQVSLHP
ncbi:hypothetical protein OUZ56_010479 [Daphnia magna]|uniref:Tudor domain-containing protein n=1 Tax=Daphnia magna TaxID=35525 RepID=A0ABR0AIV7_9CRUS|nr:hypothetical protein OUZ56_010479 [Daphnia magna]